MKRKEAETTERGLKEKTRKLSIKDGISYGVMEGAGLRYITPYALAIGANNAQIGLLTSIPSLLGNFSQLFTPKAIERYSRKKIIMLGSLLQALMWIPILFVGYLFFYKNVDHGFSATLMIIFFTLLTIFGAFLSPAWNSLMREIVGKKTGKYFGNRSKIIGITVLGIMLISGLVLNYFKKINLLFFGFVIIFGVALIARLVSWYFLTKHYESKFKFKDGYYFRFGQFIKRIPHSNFGKFVVFISLVMFGTAIASPFFAVYMLKDLQFSYTAWTLIVISGALSSFIFMPLWGKFADKFGNIRVLRFTGAFIPLVPALWFLTLFMTKINAPLLVSYLFVIEFFSGFIWAGFNLSAANFIYDAVSKQKFALCIAYSNILNGVGIFLGATLGGFVSSFNFNFFGISSLLLVFLLSAVVRFLVYIIMISKLKEVREVEKYKDGELRKEIEEMFSPPYKKFNIHPIRPF